MWRTAVTFSWEQAHVDKNAGQADKKDKTRDKLNKSTLIVTLLQNITSVKQT